MGGPLDSLYSLRLKFGKVNTDNIIFRLHYRVTVLLLTIFTILVTSKQFFGDPIRCIGDEKPKFEDAINSYCWLMGTSTVEKHLKGEIGKDVAHRGVGPHVKGEGKEILHLYYQWVCLFLPFQAALFYAPHALWKIWEGGKIKGLTEDLKAPLMPTQWDKDRRIRLVKHLINTNLYTHNFYAFQFAFCEFLNLCNVVFQMFILDKFFGGLFTGYGAAVVAFYRDPLNPDFTNPMDHIFPKVTKCLFHTYGSSGGIQVKDFMCILPLNVINEKIFMFLWFWLILLSVLSALAMLHRLLVLMSPYVRAYIIITQAKLVSKNHVFTIVKKFRCGDWYMLHLMGKNLNCFVFKDLITLLGKELEESNLARKEYTL